MISYETVRQGSITTYQPTHSPDMKGGSLGSGRCV
nr:MAG TPA: hypothetical protein [Caudoviricetes sp.]